LDAWFPSEKSGSAGQFGQVQMTPSGLAITPPAKVGEQLAIYLVAASTGRFDKLLTTAKGRSFVIPYTKIKDLKTVDVKIPLIGKRSIIELGIIDEKKDALGKVKFAPCEGKLPVKYKTAEFYEELMSKVSEASKTS
jgi:hypothetical protein